MNFILFTYFACIYTFFHYCLTVSCRLMCSWSVLKGHSQRMHMRISYHFLADLYITRHAHETESEEHIPNTLNKTSRIELVTSRNPDYSPYICHIRALILLYTFGNSLTDLSSESQTSTITSEFDHQKRWEMTESAWIVVKGSRSQKLDFPNICILFHHFSIYIYNDYLLSNVIDSFLLLFW